MRASFFRSSTCPARVAAGVWIAILAGGIAIADPASTGTSVAVARHDLPALRDRLLSHVLRDRPAEATLLGIGLKDLSQRAAAHDEMAGHAIEALEADRIADALSTIEAAAANAAAEDASKASDLWIMAGLIRGRGDWAAATYPYERALALAPNDIDALYGHAKALIALGRNADGRAELTRLVATTSRERSLFYQYWGRLHLATLDIDAGRLGDADATLRDIDGRLTRFVAAQPIALDWERDLAVAWHRLGEAYTTKTDATAAVAAHMAGLKINERLVAADPTSGQWLRDLCYAQQVSGDALVAKGDDVGALAIYEKSLANALRGIGSQPREALWRKDGAAVGEKIADLLIAKGEFARATTLLQDAISVATWQGRILKETDGRWHADVSRRETKLAALYNTKLHDLTHAIYWYDALRSIDAWLVRVAPKDRARLRDLAAAYGKLGDVQARSGDLRAANDSFGHVLAIDTKLAADDPSDARVQVELAALYESTGDAAAASHDTTRAVDIFKLDVATRMLLAKSPSAEPAARRAAALASEKLGDAQAASGDKPAALAAYRTSVAMYETLLAADPRDPRAQRDLAVALNEAGCMELASGDAASALADFTRRHHLFKAIADETPDDLENQHERLLSAFQLEDALRHAGQTSGATALLHTTRAAAAALLSHHPNDDVAAKTVAWADEQLARSDGATTAGR